MDFIQYFIKVFVHSLLQYAMSSIVSPAPLSMVNLASHAATALSQRHSAASSSHAFRTALTLLSESLNHLARLLSLLIRLHRLFTLRSHTVYRPAIALPACTSRFSSYRFG